MAEEPELVCVLTCQGWDLAQIYKSKLEAARIPVLLKYETAGLLFGITVDGLGEVRILVPKAFVDEASALLEEAEESSTTESEEQEEESASDEPGAAD